MGSINNKGVRDLDEKYSTNCQFNNGVECFEHNLCSRCGWNPSVDAGRKKMIQIYGTGISVNGGRSPKPPGPEPAMTDAECMEFIERHYQAYGGCMNQAELREEMHIGSRRCAELINRVRERMGY